MKVKKPSEKPTFYPVTKKRLPPVEEIFRKNLIATREAFGISQRELARRSGSTGSSICDFEKKRRKTLTLGTAQKLANALGVPLAFLVTLRK